MHGPPRQRFAAGKALLGDEVVRSTGQREAWHNIKFGDELSDPRSWNRRKRHRHCSLSICIADRAVKTITQVARMALNVELVVLQAG